MLRSRVIARFALGIAIVAYSEQSRVHSETCPWSAATLLSTGADPGFKEGGFLLV